MTKIIVNSSKEYPDMIRVYIYREPIRIPEYDPTIKRRPHDPNIFAQLRNIRRTRTMISDYVLANRFEYFATFTFDRRKVNRYDVAACKTVMSTWLHRQRQHSPDLKYLIVPEFHKDGALHFHALLGNFNGRLRDSGKKRNGRVIYNLSGYRSGFSTAVPIDEDYDAVSAYLKKYITKDMPVMFAKKRFWASRNLVRPVKSYNNLFKLDNLPIFRRPVYENDRLEIYDLVK